MIPAESRPGPRFASSQSGACATNRSRVRLARFDTCCISATLLSSGATCTAPSGRVRFNVIRTDGKGRFRTTYRFQQPGAGKGPAVEGPRGRRTVSPISLPISARATGELTEIRPCLMSASRSPTIW